MKDYINILQLLVLAIIIYLVYRLFNNLGIIRTGKEKQALNIDLTDYYNANYWRKVQAAGQTAMIIKQDKVNEFIKEFNKAKLKAGLPFVYFVDILYNIFGQLNYKTQVSYFAEKVYADSKTNLAGWLKKNLTAKELEKLMSITNKLK